VIFRQTPIPGLVLVDQERALDDRGYFARTYSAAEFRAQGLEAAIAQCSTSFNPRSVPARRLNDVLHCAIAASRPWARNSAAL